MLYPIKIIKKSGEDFILDHIRKKYVLLTPEEMVRQYSIKTMIEQYNYPKASIAIEKRIKVNNRFLRFDILIYNNAKPWLLVECKASSIELTQNTLLQSLAYNSTLGVDYILLTNGDKQLCLHITTNSLQPDLPLYPSNM